MPPPNITGKLHLGHALFLTIQDSITRYYRKSQYETLWIPGLDHAGIATHEKIMEALNNENCSNEKYDLKALEIKEMNKDNIISQIQKMGSSCDWSQTNYTLDDNFKDSAMEALKRLHNDGLIYFKDEQFYISMKKFADSLLIDIKNNEFTINDQSQINKLIHTLENIEDWCISRQIRWGMELPIYFDKSGKFHILDDSDDKTDYISKNYTLDTWFTSSLYPLAILNWASDDKTAFEKYYPTNIIETGYDILFPWCARMLMMCNYLTGEYPFKEMYFHGICRDKKGIKMSKSLGNGIDPLDIIAQYGTDALRLALISKTQSKDMKIDDEDFRNASKFMNKMYQSFRFIDMHLTQNELIPNPNEEGSFKEKMEILKNEFIDSMEKRDFLNISRKLQHSFKHEFCDIWIEENKRAIFDGSEEILQHGLYILLSYINLFHCFTPFQTEYISNHFGFTDIIQSGYL